MPVTGKRWLGLKTYCGIRVFTLGFAELFLRLRLITDAARHFMGLVSSALVAGCIARTVDGITAFSHFVTQCQYLSLRIGSVGPDSVATFAFNSAALKITGLASSCHACQRRHELSIDGITHFSGTTMRSILWKSVRCRTNDRSEYATLDKLYLLGFVSFVIEHHDGC